MTHYAQFAESLVALEPFDFLVALHHVRQTVRATRSTIGSAKTLFSAYRNAVRKCKGLDDAQRNIALNVLRLEKDEAQIFRVETIQRVSAANTQRKRVTDIDRVIETAVDLLMTDSANKILVGLALLTGRRTYELGVCGDFVISENAGHVMFSGQAKQKNGKVVPAYEIPILIDDAELVIERFQVMRGLRDLTGIDDKAFNSRFSTSIASVARAAFREVLPQFVHPKELRCIYAHIAQHCINSVVNPDGWEKEYLVKILGHGANDRATTDSYFKWRIALTR